MLVRLSVKMLCGKACKEVNKSLILFTGGRQIFTKNKTPWIQ
jgi:hypothetical protein